MFAICVLRCYKSDVSSFSNVHWVVFIATHIIMIFVQFQTANKTVQKLQICKFELCFFLMINFIQTRNAINKRQKHPNFKFYKFAIFALGCYQSNVSSFSRCHWVKFNATHKIINICTVPELEIKKRSKIAK